MLISTLGLLISKSKSINNLTKTTNRNIMSSIINTLPQPPIAKEVPHNVIFGYNKDEFRGDKNVINPPRLRNDPYYWLRDDKRESKEILNHLKAENDYANDITSNLKDL